MSHYPYWIVLFQKADLILSDSSPRREQKSALRSSISRSTLLLQNQNLLFSLTLKLFENPHSPGHQSVRLTKGSVCLLHFSCLFSCSAALKMMDAPEIYGDSRSLGLR